MMLLQFLSWNLIFKNTKLTYTYLFITNTLLNNSVSLFYFMTEVISMYIVNLLASDCSCMLLTTSITR